MKRRAVELSINFIVMFVLAMAMFGAGIMIVRQIFGHVDIIEKELTEQQREQLEAILAQGPEKVKLLYATKRISARDNDVFGLGIRNDLSGNGDFYVLVYCDAAFERDRDVICDRDSAKTCAAYEWAYVEEGPHRIAKDDRKIVEIFVRLPKEAVQGATYVYNVKVCQSSQCSPSSSQNQYDTTKQFNVVVK